MNTRTRQQVRCGVCGRTFESEDRLEHHLRDQGLLW
jgi:hypothetical protein